jgi:hypothetical protein
MPIFRSLRPLLSLKNSLVKNFGIRLVPHTSSSLLSLAPRVHSLRAGKEASSYKHHKWISDIRIKTKCRAFLRDGDFDRKEDEEELGPANLRERDNVGKKGNGLRDGKRNGS